MKQLAHDTHSNELTRKTLASALIRETRDMKAISHYANKFAKGPFAQEFSKSDIKSEVLLTITYVVNSWETYLSKSNPKKYQDYGINLSDDTKLDTFGQCRGYFINALKNNIAKKYTSLKRDKRSCFFTNRMDVGTFSDESEEKTSLLENISDNDITFNERLEKNEIISEIIKDLRSIDRSRKKSSMAKMFVALINPNNKSKKDIKTKLKMSNVLFVRKKDELTAYLRENYKSDIETILSIFNKQDNNELETRKIIDPSSYEKLTVLTSFQMKKVNGKNKYMAKVDIAKTTFSGRTEVVRNFSEHSMEDNKISYGDALNILKTKIAPDILAAKSAI